MIRVRIRLTTYGETKSYPGLLMEESPGLLLRYEDEEGCLTEFYLHQEMAEIRRPSGIMTFCPGKEGEFPFETPYGTLLFRLKTLYLAVEEGAGEIRYLLMDEAGDTVGENVIHLIYEKETDIGNHH